MKPKINIAIDGPAGSGKGTTCKLLAKKLDYKYIDTGAMYRGVALYFKENNLNYQNFSQKEFEKINLDFNFEGELLLNGENVEEKIRTPQIGELSSLKASINLEIRRFLRLKQQEIIKEKGFVLEGRDATTMIAPNAEVKIYLDCDLNERVKRRMFEFEEKGIKKGFEELKKEIDKRDYNDMNKGEYSLKISDGAVVVDTTFMRIEEQVDTIYNIVKKYFKKIIN